MTDKVLAGGWAIIKPDGCPFGSAWYENELMGWDEVWVWDFERDAELFPPEKRLEYKEHKMQQGYRAVRVRVLEVGE